MSEAEDQSDNDEDETTLDTDKDDDRFEGDEFSEYQEGDTMKLEDKNKFFTLLMGKCWHSWGENYYNCEICNEKVTSILIPTITMTSPAFRL